MQHYPEVPKYLYHYTKLDTAKKIVQNKTIRFRSLADMDDALEPVAKGFPNAGSAIYASCWSEVGESLPQWYMYGENSKGVCLKLHSFPFVPDYEKHISFISQQPIDFKYERIEKDQEVSDIYIIDPEHYYNKEYTAYIMFIGDEETGQDKQAKLSCRVRYSDIAEEIIPNILSFDEKYTHADTWLIGSTKHKGWAFQKEWRYKILFYPLSTSHDSVHKDHREAFKLFLEGYKPPFDYVDLKIGNQYFSDMEIITGPMMESETYDDFYNFVKDIAPFMKISKSIYTGTIRKRVFDIPNTP